MLRRRQRITFYSSFMGDADCTGNVLSNGAKLVNSAYGRCGSALAIHGPIVTNKVSTGRETHVLSPDTCPCAHDDHSDRHRTAWPSHGVRACYDSGQPLQFGVASGVAVCQALIGTLHRAIGTYRSHSLIAARQYTFHVSIQHPQAFGMHVPMLYPAVLDIAPPGGSWPHLCRASLRSGAADIRNTRGIQATPNAAFSGVPGLWYWYTTCYFDLAR
ncbi:uncharacterized protein B0H18DRAFT_76921 [Fomitopsis serialis]|uniref:uncharacterized protein n=1 Tax=Fomitopsis serialis TaxID=139415 RepID=UPI0020074418|nr:uncharacterized protein B0H18DRAFT_76921 [Neoantrodia serialis]KAH9916019.1 hypothetical protein B0H18DRAFT_76921 [Neoantrodia serialis]